MTGRAKWDAWNLAGKTYARPQDAEKKYLELARSLGWSGTTQVIQTVDKRKEENEEIQWDVDDAPSSREKGADGMGLGVSSIEAPDEIEDSSIHGLSVSDDVLGLTALLNQDPNVDVNELDEFVGSSGSRDAWSNHNNAGIYPAPSRLRSRKCRYR